MSDLLTKARTRSIVYGDSGFLVVVFPGLVAHNHIVRHSTAALPMTETVVFGKHVWERGSCISRHSLPGEGASFAPRSAAS